MEWEYKTLNNSINRSRAAAEEIQHESTEDEGDLATMSHNKEILYNLHEGDYARLKSIQQALNALDRGQYGECKIVEKTSTRSDWRQCHGLRYVSFVRK